MATKRNYQPVQSAITTADTTRAAVPIVTNNLETSKWPLIFVAGIAEATDNQIISNGTVVIWANTASGGTIESADYMTFTDNYGRYGITIASSNKYAVKIYS
jgi:hypothetical protein